VLISVIVVSNTWWIHRKAVLLCSAPKCSSRDSHRTMVDGELVTCTGSMRGVAIRMADVADTYDCREWYE
jgi:hypothetical protein